MQKIGGPPEISTFQDAGFIWWQLNAEIRRWRVEDALFDCVNSFDKDILRGAVCSL